MDRFAFAIDLWRLHQRVGFFVICALIGGVGWAPVAEAAQRSELRSSYPTAFGQAVSGRVELEFGPEYYRNLDLRRDADDNVSFARLKITPALLFKPTDSTDLHFEFRLESKGVFRDPADYETRFDRVKLRQAYLMHEFSAAGEWAIQAGRRRFRDDREWLFDAHLDTLRARWSRGRFDVDLSISSELIDSDKSVVNRMAFAKYSTTAGSVELFRIDRRDRDTTAHPYWYGMRVRAKPYKSLSAYADVALRRGNDGATRLRGSALDVGATWVLAEAWRPSVTLAYAYGSGDRNPRSRTDRTFRQTGLQDNNGRIAGVDTFQYYGIVSDPDLSNIEIATIAFGIRPVEKSSIELVWHGYRRNSTHARIRTSLEATPSGARKGLGQEWNLLMAYRTKTWRSNLALGWFSPGRAFGRADRAFGATGEIRILF